MAWKLYEGDCFDYLPLIEDGSVDMILCDLPYGTTACKWDTPLPLDELWFEYKRVIKDNGAIVLTASQPFTSYLVMSNPEMFKYEWVWIKKHSSNFLQCNRRPLLYHENILIFSKGGAANGNKNPMNYNPQMVEKTTPEKSVLNRYKGNLKNPKYNNIVGRNKIVKKNTHSYPKSYLNISNFNKNSLHPTQKPVALFEYLIKTYTNEGELVLDNCAGSGTTGVACENTGRNSIMMEMEPKYCQIIKDRMATVQELQLEARKQKTLNEFNGQATLDMPAK